jgi:hypothetical protein
MKLKMINKHVEERNLVYFPSCKSVYETSGGKRFAWPKERFSEIIQLLRNEYNQGSMIFTLIPVEFFFLKTLLK